MTRLSSVQRTAAIALASVALGCTAVPATVTASDEIPIAVGFYPGAMFHMLQYVSDAKGFYKQAGLKATLNPVSSGPLMNSQLAAGAIDFGYSAPSLVGVAQEQGLDLVFVAGNVTMPWILIARSNLNLPNQGRYPEVMRDLKGLNWGVYGRASDGEVFMRVMARDAKLDVDKDMAWIGVGGPPSGLPALKAGKIDVYLTLSPAHTVATALGYGKIVLDLRKGEGPGDFKGIVYQGVVTLRKTAQANSKAVDGIVKAHSNAYCWINNPKNFPELLEILKTRLPVGELSRPQFEEVVRESIPTLSLTIPAPHFVVWNEMLVRSKVLKAPVAADRQIWSSVPASNPSCGG